MGWPADYRKVCSQCGEAKLIAEFRKSGDGRAAKCEQCREIPIDTRIESAVLLDTMHATEIERAAAEQCADDMLAREAGQRVEPMAGLAAHGFDAKRERMLASAAIQIATEKRGHPIGAVRNREKKAA